MRFAARRVHSTVFPGIPLIDFVPIFDLVYLLTAGGRVAQTRGRERRWPALCDTGAIISVIPWISVAELGLTPSGRTRPLRAFDGYAARFPWYHVVIGLPDLPPFKARAIAPADRDPLRPRRHITLGRDIISRLSLRWESTLPWNTDVPPGVHSSWTWDYERRSQ